MAGGFCGVGCYSRGYVAEHETGRGKVGVHSCLVLTLVQRGRAMIVRVLDEEGSRNR